MPQQWVSIAHRCYAFMYVRTVFSLDLLGSKYQLHFESDSVSGVVECIEIVIIDDDLKEDNESFLIFLSPGRDKAVHLVNSHVEVHIIDDDCMLLSGGLTCPTISDPENPAGVNVILSLESQAGTVLEGNGAMLVLVELEGEVYTDVTVIVQTSGGSGEF